MAAFKTLNSQDIIISPLEVARGFSFEGNALTASDVGVDRYLGNRLATTSSTGYLTAYSQSSVYFQTQQLYYSNFISSSNGNVQIANTQSINPDGTTSARMGSNYFVNFEQSDLLPQKYWPTGSEDIAVLSIPRSLFGDYILPNSINIITDSGSYVDDGEGRLQMHVSSSQRDFINVGNVIYEHGIIVFTGGTRKQGTGISGSYGEDDYGSGIYDGRLVSDDHIENFVSTTNITCSFSSSFTIYETQYKCTIGESEFNYTLNPTLIKSGSNIASVDDFATGSYFDPYVTTVGLYSNDQELLAVGKLAQPLPTSRTTDTTILVNIDRQ